MNEPFHKDMLDRSRRDRPLYLQVYEILQTHIRDVRNSGNILPSTRELARMFDVAENTIRQAMTLLTDAGLVCRIRHRGTVLVSEQLPDDPQGNSRSIGLVFPAEGYSFWRDLLQIMHSEAEKNGYSLDIYLYCWDNLADERRALSKAFRSSSGVILYPNPLGNDRQLITEFNRRRIPLVLFLLYYDDLDIEEACSIVQKYRAVMGEQYAEYWKIAQSRKNDPLDVAYEKAKAICVSGNPVPAAYGEFFKLCRKKNIADKRAKKYQAVVDRIALMLILDKKQLDVIWLTNAMHNGIKRSVIDEHYSLITITDKKNFKVCKELLKKC